MAKVVKYDLTWGRNAVKIPGRGKPRHVAWQVDALRVWVEVEPNWALTERIFFVAATGQDLPHDIPLWDFVGTAMSESGEIVAHVYVQR